MISNLTAFTVEYRRFYKTKKDKSKNTSWIEWYKKQDKKALGQLRVCS